MIQRPPIRIAIIGTGNIGTDLCYRMLQDTSFEVVAFVGRRADSPGIRMFENKIQIFGKFCDHINTHCYN